MFNNALYIVFSNMFVNLIHKNNKIKQCDQQQYISNKFKMEKFNYNSCSVHVNIHYL